MDFFLPEFYLATALITLAVTHILVRAGSAEYTALTASFVVGVGNVVLLGAYGLWAEPLRGISLRAVLFFLGSGLFGYTLSRTCLNISFARIGVTRSTALHATAPLFSTVAAILFLQERPGPAALAGTVGVVAGVLIMHGRGEEGGGRRSDLLLPLAAGAMARPFETEHHALSRHLFLRIATELHLKRLVVGGFERVYEIGRIFRNEGIDASHNPEFTTMESYQAYADYQDVMEMVEQMVSSVAEQVTGSMVVPGGDGQDIDLTPPWTRLSLLDAVREWSEGIDLLEDRFRTADGLRAAMRERGLTPARGTSWPQLADKLVSDLVEPRLIQPTFLTDYPVEMTPLAKAVPGEPLLVERFEAFVRGTEIANSFTELNDPVEQRARLEAQEEARREFGADDFDRLDEDFLVAMEHGMPPTGGLGIGIDRLVMLLTAQTNIREVVLFPQLRSLE